MKLSSNSLFHFTPKMEYLTDIIEFGFWPRYCQEFGWGNSFIDFAIPMVCFCDIPLSLIKEHSNFYGGFGIGISKEWVRKHKTISPVHYIALKSYEFYDIKKLITLLKNHQLDKAGINQLIRVKKVSGKTIDKNGKLKNKKFYDVKLRLARPRN